MNEILFSDTAKQCRGNCDAEWLTHDDPLCPLYEGNQPADDEDLLPRRQPTPKKLSAA